MDARIACNPITSLYAVKPTDQERSSQQNENSQNITEILERELSTRII